MSLLSLAQVTVAYGAETVVRGVDLRIEARDRLAVVGANGSGKTSVLGVIAGTLTPTEGTRDPARGLRIAVLPQDAPEPVAGTVLEEVLASRTDLVAMRARLGELEQAMGARSADLGALMAAYGELQHTYQDASGYDVEARAREALGGLGIDETLRARDPRALSGGQKRRVELAKLLLADADLLLIDEPTNHLDLASIEWLEGYMRDVRTTFVLVSHDRRFLDRVCTSVLELAHGRAEEYPGNYSQYLRLRAERQARRQKEFDTQRALIEQQEDFIRRYRAGQRAREARGRQKQLDRLHRLVAPVRERRPRLRFSAAPTSQILVKSGELKIGRDDVELLDLRPFSIAPGERIAVVGPNGSGKSTLLHTLAGDLPPLAGRLNLGPRTVRRLYRQDLGTGAGAGGAAGENAATEHHDAERTVADELLAEHPVAADRARALLGALLFSGDDALKPLSALSGGERARLLLGKLALEPTNLLLLDEPTNHLDIPAQEVLEDALLGYPGAMVLVTHDRALIDAVATRTWALEAGSVREVLGGYTELLRIREREQREQERARRPAGRDRSGAPAAAAQARPGSSPRALRLLEAEIAELESELATARQRLLDPETFADVATGAEAGRAHDRLSGALAELYERWSDLAGGG